MQLKEEKHGKYLVINASGRLEASWAEYFTATLSGFIRDGHHHLVIDASALSYLSSAGIRSLMCIFKELDAVEGSFQIINAPPFIARTLEMTGLKSWLADGITLEIRSAGQPDAETGRVENEVYVLNPSAKLTFSLVADWKPWQAIDPDRIRRMKFPSTLFALGIGGAGEDDIEANVQYGDFLAVNGHVIFKPPEERARPDFLLAEKDYIPELLVLQALCCEGEMSHLVRFTPDENKSSVGISEISEQVLELTKSESAAFILLAEADGLVGANLSRSPGFNPGPVRIQFPEIRDWLSFCGEKVYHGHLALVFGIIAKSEGSGHSGWLAPLPSDPAISGHFHAAVFHDHPLQNGKIELMQNVSRLLNGPAPLDLLHLIDDNRPSAGLGQSSFIRGACWCSGIITGKEEKQ